MKRKAQLQVPGTAVDFYSYIVFAVIILLFLVLFQVRSCATKGDEIKTLQENLQKTEAETILLNYLRTPVQIDLNRMDPDKPIVLQKTLMADVISMNPTDYVLIQEITKQAFKNYKTDKSFQILFNIEGGKCIFDCGTIQPAACSANDNLNNIVLPLTDSNSVNIGFCYWTAENVNEKEFECRTRAGC